LSLGVRGSQGDGSTLVVPHTKGDVHAQWPGNPVWPDPLAFPTIVSDLNHLRPEVKVFPTSIPTVDPVELNSVFNRRGCLATYLLTWNPDRWEWRGEKTSTQTIQIDSGERVVDQWSTGTTKRIQPGDRLFLLKLGSTPRGIFASGRAVSDVYEGDHYNQSRDDTANYVELTYDAFIDPYVGPILDHDALYEALPGERRWSPQGSGVSVPESDEATLEELWQTHLIETANKSPIPLVGSLLEVREGIDTFDRCLRQGDEAARFATIHPIYFVYDPITDRFAPAKWAAIRGITPVTYTALQQVQKDHDNPRGFDGSRTRNHLSRLWGPFVPDSKLSTKLKSRFVAAFGEYGTDRSNDWQFLQLPRLPDGYWWVNQGKTFQEEVDGGFIWAPQESKTGSSLFHWDNVAEVKPGDLVFCYSKKHIRAVGQAVTEGDEGPKPESIASDEWNEDGWTAKVLYHVLSHPIPLQKVNNELLALNLERGPLTQVGSVNQGYLYELTKAAADIILKNIDEEIPFLVEKPNRRSSGRNMPKANGPQNIILHGPPGTGKTYRAIADAVRLCDGSTPQNRAEVGRRFAELRDQGRVGFVTFHQSYGYEEFVEGIRPVLVDTKQLYESESTTQEPIVQPTAAPGSQVYYECRGGAFKAICEAAGAPASTQDPDESPADRSHHVLIIDEINRGNIAKIFGELITLLEPDKRIDQANEIRVRLPYSGEMFGVPSNLHVIGTMNTADRSIAFLDTALRRRFRFEEIMPDPTVVRRIVGENGTIGGIDVAEMLACLNERVELLFDRDHTLGHSYFLGIESLEDLRDAFLWSIIPLLKEYFYEDWSKVCVVLGCPYDSETGKRRFDEGPAIIETRILSSGTRSSEDFDEEGRISYSIAIDFQSASKEKLAGYFQHLLRRSQR